MTNKKNKYNSHRKQEHTQAPSKAPVNEEELAAQALQLH
jgi:hypothetical protein